MSINIINIDPYKMAVESASSGHNTVVYDRNGYPNIMVVIPQFKYRDCDFGFRSVIFLRIPSDGSGIGYITFKDPHNFKVNDLIDTLTYDPSFIGSSANQVPSSENNLKFSIGRTIAGYELAQIVDKYTISYVLPGAEPSPARYAQPNSYDGRSLGTIGGTFSTNSLHPAFLSNGGTTEYSELLIAKFPCQTTRSNLNTNVVLPFSSPGKTRYGEGNSYTMTGVGGFSTLGEKATELMLHMGGSLHMTTAWEWSAMMMYYMYIYRNGESYNNGAYNNDSITDHFYDLYGYGLDNYSSRLSLNHPINNPSGDTIGIQGLYNSSTTWGIALHGLHLSSTSSYSNAFQFQFPINNDYYIEKTDETHNVGIKRSVGSLVGMPTDTSSALKEGQNLTGDTYMYPFDTAEFESSYNALPNSTKDMFKALGIDGKIYRTVGPDSLRKIQYPSGTMTGSYYPVVCINHSVGELKNGNTDYIDASYRTKLGSIKFIAENDLPNCTIRFSLLR